jgi:hypothetical protein
MIGTAERAKKLRKQIARRLQRSRSDKIERLRGTNELGPGPKQVRNRAYPPSVKPIRNDKLRRTYRSAEGLRHLKAMPASNFPRTSEAMPFPQTRRALLGHPDGGVRGYACDGSGRGCALRPLLLAVSVLVGSLCCCTAGFAQQTAVSTITFTCDFPGSEPDHYAISLSDDGSASYDSDSKLSPESPAGDRFHSDFTVAQAGRIRVFDLAKRAHYFEGQIDSRNKNLASTGIKTLTYKDAQKSTRASYNYSPVPSVQQLTAFFQGLSTTLEFGHRLEYYLHYQKLALDEELKKMEEMSNSGGLEEISAVAPILQKIGDDPAVIKVVRARALRLLQLPDTRSK